MHDKLAEMASELLNKAISNIFSGQVSLQLQDNSLASYSKILTKEDGRINWQKPAQAIERQIRALAVWPRSYTFFNDKGKSKRIKIIEAETHKSIDGKEYSIGQVLNLSPDKIGVQCGQDLLVINKLQVEGKQEITIADFLRGYPNFVGAILK